VNESTPLMCRLWVTQLSPQSSTRMTPTSPFAQPNEFHQRTPRN
jgi:hypothetical protein